MSLVKKQNRQFRARRQDSDESDTDNPNLTVQPKKTEKKKSSTKIKTSSSAVSLLSFDGDNEEGTEEFKVKKSKRSQRRAQQLKEAHLKEIKNDEKKKLPRQPSVAHVQASSLQTGGNKLKILSDASDVNYVGHGVSLNGSNNNNFATFSNSEHGQSAAVKDGGSEPGVIYRPSSDESEDSDSCNDSDREGKASPMPTSGPLRSIIQSGAIPDAATIHEARKLRQRAREQQGELVQQGSAGAGSSAAGDFIPLDDLAAQRASERESKSRLIRDDDNDASDDGAHSGGEEDDRYRMKFTINKSAQDRHRVQESFLRTEHVRTSKKAGLTFSSAKTKADNMPLTSGSLGLVDEEEEEEDAFHRFEQEQIRKGVSVIQPSSSSVAAAAAAAAGSVDMGSVYQHQVPASLTSAHIPPAMDTANIMSISELRKHMEEQLDTLRSTHRAHHLERDALQDRLINTSSDISEREASIQSLSGQFSFFQDMLGYVTDLADCFNEKLPQIESLEKRMVEIYRQRAKRVCERRRADVQDQADMYAGGNTVHVDTLSAEARRRYSEREARRARRRRAREAQLSSHAAPPHQDGWSTDDEQTTSESSAADTAKQQVLTEAGEVVADVIDDFSTFTGVLDKMKSWRDSYPHTYQEAYIGLCVPKVLTPLLRLEMISWNPLLSYCADFEEEPWFTSVLFYPESLKKAANNSDDSSKGGESSGDAGSVTDDDKLLSTLVERVVIPKLAVYASDVWDPTSSSETRRLLALCTRLCEDYLTITADSKHVQALLSTMSERVRTTLDHDVYIPLYPPSPYIKAFSSQSPPHAFAQRQFWSACKLLSNLCHLYGLLDDEALKALALDALLNRYLLIHIINSTVDHQWAHKCTAIVNALPKKWLSSGEQTLPQLQNLSRVLVNAVRMLNARPYNHQFNSQTVRELSKQILKMLVDIKSKEAAVELSNTFSIVA